MYIIVIAWLYVKVLMAATIDALKKNKKSLLEEKVSEQDSADAKRDE